MKITGKTKVVGIFGDPVEHSLSPAMHNAAFEVMGIDYVYVPFHVKSDNDADLEKAVDGIRAMNIAGVNVTIPYKERVIKFLDDLHESAHYIGAVNTIVNDNGRLVGHNTDGEGYISGLKAVLNAQGIKDFSLKNKKVVIIGAGGSARAILVSLILRDVKQVIIANRDVDRAKVSLKDISEYLQAEVSLKDISSQLHNADILINTTPVGMMGIGSLDIDLDKLPNHAIVSDIVYAPLETDLLKRARARGLKAIPGISMLIHQGGIAFELWTGVKLGEDVMLNCVYDIVKGALWE